MTKEEQIFNEAKKPMAMHPKKFALWLFLVTVIMVFASLTSYYIVRRAEGGWLEFELPGNFYISTLIILLSSASMHWAYYSARKDDFQNLKLSLLITTLLGFGFLLGQVSAGIELHEGGIKFASKFSNVAGDILYVLAGLHMAHVIGGVIFLLVVLLNSLRLRIHSKSMVQIEMCATYWHFLGALWIYLFVFLLLNH
jgi:cytochrome c oxidase subunit 3